MKHALDLSLLYNIETDGKVIHHQTFLVDFFVHLRVNSSVKKDNKSFFD